MDKALNNIVVQKLLTALSLAVSSEDIAILVDPDKYPILVGVPLEILDASETELILSSGNLNIPNGDRIIVDPGDAELFYSIKSIQRAFHDSVGSFLDEELVSILVGHDDPDFDKDLYEDF
jgi:hypothetical protein